MAEGDAERFICIHGHFYQPPRDNPWLDAIEVQDSAAPFHDWNERVTAECYQPNSVARLLDESGSIVALRNNYERISFNFGPTLLSWLEKQRPDTYAAIQAGDRAGFRRYGRGNALAQVYGHCIMPLASPRDRSTQTRWGVADFVHRFGRRPEGMWLPETAVDIQSLRALVEQGIRFTILAPGQAARIRYAGGTWQPANEGFDSARPYRCDLGNGRSMTVFFYDGALAHAVAFGGLLNNGRDFARRLLDSAAAHDAPALIHIATDGESYGHHHRFGEMALAAALDAIGRERGVRLTNYAAYLERFPPRDEAEIREASSWSCPHGVERWRANCGCRLSSDVTQQEWRRPLRDSLTWLKQQVDACFERYGAGLLNDVWAARDAYINVILEPSRESRDVFIERQQRNALTQRERTRVWQLLEMQRFCLLSFTSCGWFFDDPSGLETVQVLTYAARAMQLAALLGSHLQGGFLSRLEPMHSNSPEYGNGRVLYRSLVEPWISDDRRIVAHYAINGLLDPPRRESHSYGYHFTTIDNSVQRSDTATLAVGRTRMLAGVTENGAVYDHAALHLGGHDMQCVVALADEEFAKKRDSLVSAFRTGPLTDLVRRMDAIFPGDSFTLRDVFTAERRRILDRVTTQALADCSAEYDRIITRNRRLMEFLAQGGGPVPAELRVAATFVLQRRFEEAIDSTAESASAEPALRVMAEAQRWGVPIDTAKSTRRLERAVVATIQRLHQSDVRDGVDRAHAMLDAVTSLGLPIDLSEAQNQYYGLFGGDPVRAKQCDKQLRALGERLQFRLPEWSE
ncbi:MAG TPA: DUF3536 domain-containing protein [Candidatus Acidoferrales bacterium]|nr:DUF3536 domain-containing protein [Candidatus Acidoferrales bacterium]